MIPASVLRMKIYRERSKLRKEVRSDFILGAIWGMTYCSRLLGETIRESREHNMGWPRRVSWRHAGELYLAIQGGLSYLRAGRIKLAIDRLAKAVRRYESEKVPA